MLAGFRRRVARTAGMGIGLARGLQAARSRERWPAAQLAAFQRQQLVAVVRAAAARVPSFAARLPCGRFADALDADAAATAALPVTERHHLRAIHGELVALGRWPRATEKRTGGSTGSPLPVLKPLNGVARELAVTWRGYGWLGLEFGDRAVRIWGRPPAGRFMAAAKGLLQNTRRISAYDLTDEQMAARLRQIERIGPVYLYGYAFALREFAACARRVGFEPPRSLKAVIATADPLDDDTRRVVDAAFRTRCRDEYGSSEVGTIAHECPDGAMHVNADNLVVEVLGDDGVVRPEGFGELLVTDLTNTLTPVIRYRLGDYGTLQPAAVCGCGVTLPVIREILGRVADTIVTPDGVRHHSVKVRRIVNRVLAALGGHDYQVVQTHPRRMELRVVTGGSAIDWPALVCRVQAEFAAHLHRDMRVDVTPVSAIARESSGKYRLVKNLVEQSGPCDAALGQAREHASDQAGGPADTRKSL